MSKNAELIGIPDSVSDNELEYKVAGTFPAINIKILSHGFEDCNAIGKSQYSLKKTIVGFPNQRVVENAL